MRKIAVVFFISVMLLAPHQSSAGEEKLYLTAPAMLPHTNRQMHTSGYWISRHPNPDQPVLDETGVADLNHRIHQKGLTRDLENMPPPTNMALAAAFEDALDKFSDSSYFLPDGKSASKDFYRSARAAMNIPGIPPEVVPQYGVVVHFTNQRFFPDDVPLTAEPLDVNFDELQNSALDVGTPVVILHKSADGRWLYVYSPSSDGWVKAEDVGLAKKAEWREFLHPPIFVVITSAKADVYLDPQMTQFDEYILMGNVLPFTGAMEGAAIAVKIPRCLSSGELQVVTGYIKKEDVHVGYLPYTPRTIIEQAFKLNNTPYGWGGMYGEQDCSRFLQEVFATVGIQLPRNSSDQANAGQALGIFEQSTGAEKRMEALNQAAGGKVILPMKGHIMLYLGEVDGRFYAIHAAWGFREPVADGEQTRVINRVVVSDLSLGEGSHRGSLLQRLTAVVNVE